MRFCTSCKKEKHDKYFDTNRHGNLLCTCRQCLAEQKKERGESNKFVKPEFVWPHELTDWATKHARKSHKSGQLKTIKAYDCAGMDEGNLIRGNAIERVTVPLFGNPMYTGGR